MVALLYCSNWIRKCLGDGILEEENYDKHFEGGKGCVFREEKTIVWRAWARKKQEDTYEGYLTMEKREDRLAVIRGQWRGVIRWEMWLLRWFQLVEG